MGYRTFCDECNTTISEGYARVAHLTLTHHGGAPADDDEGEYGMPSRDFCDMACLRAYLASGKDAN